MASALEVNESFAVCLLMLQQECKLEEFKAALLTLLKILRNVQDNPTNDKYRHLRKENKTFKEKVWKYDGARQFLMAGGWVDIDDSIFLADDSNIDSAVQHLEDLRSALPDGQDSTAPPPNTTTPDLGSSWTDTEQREKERLIAEERKRQYEQMKKEKEERKKLNEQIKKDRQDTNTREVKDSHARQLGQSSGMKRFSDIGVDTNQGGG